MSVQILCESPRPSMMGHIRGPHEIGGVALLFTEQKTTVASTSFIENLQLIDKGARVSYAGASHQVASPAGAHFVDRAAHICVLICSSNSQHLKIAI